MAGLDSQSTASSEDVVKPGAPVTPTLGQPPVITQPPKTVQQPHVWTVALSLVAIVVSGLSYQESHRSRVMNEEINRPLVRVVDVESLGPVLGSIQSVGDKYENSFHLQLKNSGKAFAYKVKVSYRAQLDDSRSGAGFRRFSDFSGETSNSADIGDLAPDDSYDLALWALVLKNNPTIPFGEHKVNMVSIYITGRIEYSNQINNAVYHENFCFYEPGTEGPFQRCAAGEPKPH